MPQAQLELRDEKAVEAKPALDEAHANGGHAAPAAAEPARIRGGGYADQMLRQVMGSHVQYSQMADAKANMMMTVAAIVIPLSAQHINTPGLHWPAMTMIVFCGMTVALAAYAALPKLVLDRQDSPPDVSSSSFNLLFFGDFTKLDFDSFRSEMLHGLSEPQRTYENQIREIYTVGQYLARQKYRYVRYAYLTFIAGMSLSSAIYVVGQMI